MRILETTQLSYPNAPCMEYLPTFGLNLWYVNISYMGIWDIYSTYTLRYSMPRHTRSLFIESSKASRKAKIEERRKVVWDNFRDSRSDGLPVDGHIFRHL